VRYIALGDGIDTFSQSNNNDMSPFKSVINRKGIIDEDMFLSMSGEYNIDRKVDFFKIFVYYKQYKEEQL